MEAGKYLPFAARMEALKQTNGCRATGCQFTAAPVCTCSHTASTGLLEWLKCGCGLAVLISRMRWGLDHTEVTTACITTSVKETSYCTCSLQFKCRLLCGSEQYWKRSREKAECQRLLPQLRFYYCQSIGKGSFYSKTFGAKAFPLTY